MISTIEAQFIFIIVSIYAGLMIGLLFDLYRTINLVTRPGKFFQGLMDILFWLTATVITFIILLRADYAMLRIYTFMGLALGIFIYSKLFSVYVLKFYRWMVYSVINSVRFSIILITFPFKLLYNVLWSPVNALRKAIVSGTKVINKKISSKLKRIHKNK
jgi:spore cortex biosynthesis protein YabQ